MDPRMQMMQQMMGHGHSHDGSGHGHSHGGGGACHGHGDPQQAQQYMAEMLRRVQAAAQAQENGGSGAAGGAGPSKEAIQNMMERIQKAQAMLQAQAEAAAGNSDDATGAQAAGMQAKESGAEQETAVAQNFPHLQKGWMFRDPRSSQGPIEGSWLFGSGHYTPPVFGWGELARAPGTEDLEEKTEPLPNITSPLSQTMVMPHESGSGGVIHCTVPWFGRLRFLTDPGGMAMVGVVILYWLMGNFGTWNVILLPQYHEGHMSLLPLLWYGAIAALCITSLFKASTINPGRVPVSVDKDNKDYADWSYCHVCDQKRPPRAHHCRRCQQCVLKMDHHCPWINNCVGQENHFAFMLLIMYAFLLSATTLALDVMYFLGWLAPCQTCDPIAFTTQHQWGLVVTTTVQSVLMVMFSTGLICSQKMGLCFDYTTLEWMQIEREAYTTGKVPEKLPKRTRSLGAVYRELCGDAHCLLWLFPCRRRSSKSQLRAQYQV